MPAPGRLLVAQPRHQWAEPHRHSRRHALHVGLGHPGADRHGRQVGDAHHPGRLVGGVQRLAFAGLQRDDRAVHRRINARVRKPGLLGAQRGSRFLHLRLQAGDAGLCHLQRRLRILQVLAGGCILLQQATPPLELLTGLSHLDALLRHLSLQRRQRRAGALHHGLLHVRIDLQKQLAALHIVTHLHMDALDLTRDLRTHVHVTARLHRARGRDQQLDVRPGHPGRGRRHRWRTPPPPAARGQQEQYRDHRQPATP